MCRASGTIGGRGGKTGKGDRLASDCNVEALRRGCADVVGAVAGVARCYAVSSNRQTRAGERAGAVGERDRAHRGRRICAGVGQGHGSGRRGCGLRGSGHGRGKGHGLTDCGRRRRDSQGCRRRRHQRRYLAEVGANAAA